MAHSYDLLLQAKTPGEAAPVAALVTELLTRGAKVDALGRGTWKFPDGEVTLEPLVEEGQVKGLDVRVPFVDRTALMEDVVKRLNEVAEVVGGRVSDPQRGEPASLSGLGLLLEEYTRMARYAGEYQGVSEALGLSTWASPPEEDSSTLRWVLIIAVFVLALWASWRTVTSMRESDRPEQTPAPMNGPPKVPRK